MIIALSGYAQAGKDATAGTLIEEHSFVRYAFADALRDCAYALNPIVTKGGVRVQEIVDSIGWNEAKTSYDEIRRLLQAFGTEVGRQILGENIWVDTVFRQIEEAGHQKVVITDCRFPNEAQAVHDAGGFVVRVTRPGVHPVNGHPSETSLDDWGFDYTVPNNAGLAELRSMVNYMYDELLLMEAHRERLPTMRLPGYGAPTAKVQ